MSSEKFVPIPETLTEKDFKRKPIEAGLSDYFGLGDEIPDNEIFKLHPLIWIVITATFVKYLDNMIDDE